MAMIPGTGKSTGGPRSEDGRRALCPEGVQRIVCCDVVDLGMVTDTWGGHPKVKHKVQLRWLSEHTAPNGQMFLLTKRYTYSLHERSSLRRDLNMWRGKPISEEDAATFDLERLIGVNALANIGHRDRRGETYAEVLVMMPLPKDKKKLAVPSTYTRASQMADDTAPPEEEDDAPPF